jgi:hypothetical protein
MVCTDKIRIETCKIIQFLSTENAYFPQSNRFWPLPWRVHCPHGRLSLRLMQQRMTSQWPARQQCDTPLVHMQLVAVATSLQYLFNWYDSLRSCVYNCSAHVKRETGRAASIEQIKKITRQDRPRVDGAKQNSKPTCYFNGGLQLLYMISAMYNKIGDINGVMLEHWGSVDVRSAPQLEVRPCIWNSVNVP